MIFVGNIYAGLGGGSGTMITLTTLGTSGPATLIGTVLNIPDYSAGGTGVLTLDNGLTLSGSNGQLGGTLIIPTTLTGSDGTPFQVVINPGGTGSELTLSNTGSFLGSFDSGGTLFKSVTMSNTPSTGILVTDDIDMIGLVGAADFTDPAIPNQYLQRAALDPTGNGLLKIVASVNKEGQTAAVTMLSFTPSAPGTFRVNIYANYNSGTGAVSDIILEYDDIRSHSYSYGIITSNIDSGNTGTQIPPQVINAASGFPINVLSSITGVINYDYTIVIEQLPLPPVT
jgi:hypothetical protein